jgi:glycolate oxidase
MIASAALTEALGGVCHVVDDHDVLAGYRYDNAAPGLLEAGQPAVLARPQTLSEVQSVMRIASETMTPVVPRGAGSGLSGGANAIDGCVLLSLELMDRIEEIDEASLTATVEPGVINDRLRADALRVGLTYAPDPASSSFSTIGGNVATNAGGLCCVKYGVTRDAVLGLELVLADGRVVEFGRRTRKGVVGYDLAALVVGSEGTLGVVTRATVRLMPIPQKAATLAAAFPSLGAAGAAVKRICRTEVPSLLELMDMTSLRAVEAFQPMDLDLDAAAYLFARADTGPASVSDIERMAACCNHAGASLIAVTDEEAEGRMIMAARRLAYPALESQGSTLLDDVGVPIAAIPRFLDGVERIADEFELVIGTFGHAGDGNMHPTIVYDRRSTDATAAARGAFGRIVEFAMELGGVVSGEHGIGALKPDYARAQLGSTLPLHHAIKALFDPANIMNPGKAF